MFKSIKKVMEALNKMCSLKIVTKGSSVSINGVPYSGHNVSIYGDKIVIDGKEVDSITSKTITVTVNGDCESVETASGDISVEGSVHGGVETVSGDIKCGDIMGQASTVSGDISCRVLNGNASTLSGDICK